LIFSPIKVRVNDVTVTAAKNNQKLTSLVRS